MTYKLLIFELCICFISGIKLVRPTGGQVQVSANTTAANEFDGKRMRRSIQRRTVDYNASAIQMLKVSRY